LKTLPKHKPTFSGRRSVNAYLNQTYQEGDFEKVMEIRKYFNKADKIEEVKAYNKSLSLKRSKIVEEKEDEEFSYDANKFWVINS
jgi:hypothetical protein